MGYRSSYGDHSYDHDHGPAGYWDGREHERPPGYGCVAQPERYELVDRRPRVSPEEHERIERAYREKEQAEADAKVAGMTADEIVRSLILGFDGDATMFCAGGVRSNVSRRYYNAIRRRFVGGPDVRDDC